MLEKNVPILKIDSEGVFKYIQIKMTNKKDPNDSKILVRGSARFKYHDENFQNFLQENNITSDDPYNYECIGGGRIEITNNRAISVYGYSSRYGRCDHELTCQIIKQYFPYAENFQVTWSNEGY